MWLHLLHNKSNKKAEDFWQRSRLLLSMWPKVMPTYFKTKTVTLNFDPSRSSKIKSDCANWKPMAAFKKVLPGVQPHICHCFQDILNQSIVTLKTFLKEAMGFDWHNHIWPWMTLRGQKPKSQFLISNMLRTITVKMLDPMNMTLGHINSSSLDLSPKIFGLLVIFIMHRRQPHTKYTMH